MVYDWIKNRDRFRVEVPDVEGGHALLSIVRLASVTDPSETFIRDVENHEMAVVYLTPHDDEQRRRMEDILDRLDKIGA